MVGILDRQVSQTPWLRLDTSHHLGLACLEVSRQLLKLVVISVDADIYLAELDVIRDVGKTPT